MLPELPAHLRKIGGSPYLGWIISSFALCALMARPLSGWVTDKLGRKWAMLGGTSFCVVAGLLYPITGAVWLFFLVRGIHGFSTGFAPTGFTAYTADIVPHERRGEALGWQGLFANLGSAAGFALGSAIAIITGTTGMYLTSSIMAIGAMMLFASLPETRMKQKSKAEGWNGFFYVKAWQPSVIMLLLCMPLGAVLTVMPDYTVFMGFENKGLFLSIYISFSLLVRIFSGKLSDRAGRAISTTIGSAMQVVAFLLLIFLKSDIVFFASAVFYGIGQGFNAPALFAWVGDKSNEHNRGRAMGMLFVALELGIISGALSAGYLFGIEKMNFVPVFTFNLICVALSFITSLAFTKKVYQAT